MTAAFHFTFESEWCNAPLAYWVHVPVAGGGLFDPPAPRIISHKGYALLRIQFENHELQFSAPAQLIHFIDVLSTRPLPTSRQLSSRRCSDVGPNGHWLSRLPSELKSPRKREKLLQMLRVVRTQVVSHEADSSFRLTLSGVRVHNRRFSK
jgi:hypothetical protein